MPDKLTLGSNILWESSRMMLPEHKTILKEHDKKRTDVEPKEYDEQMTEEMEYRIQQLIYTQQPARFTYYANHRYQKVTGVIESIDKSSKNVIIKGSNHRLFIHFFDFITIDV